MEKTGTILISTINRNDISQILSTYALARTIENLGYNIEIDGRNLKERSLATDYLEKFYKVVDELSIQSKHYFSVVIGSTERLQLEKGMKIETLLGKDLNALTHVSYGSTFGEKCLYELGTKNCAFFLLEQFDGIAVADVNTQEIMNNEFKIPTEKVCNPVLLSDSYKYWETGCEEGLFIFAYFDKNNNQKNRVMDMAERILRYRVADFSTYMGRKNSLDDFADAINKSSLIISDNAEIIALSIVFKKPFIAVTSKKERKSFELITMLEQLGLDERIVFLEEDILEKKYLCLKPIRYGVVDYKLDLLRKKSISWINDCLKKKEG